MAKQYISIIRLFDHSSIAYDTELNPSRIKKQLQAEFGFSFTGIIEIEGYTYNKADVFVELERLDFLQRMPYHVAVWENKSILIFLEDHIFNIHGIRPEMKPFETDPLFIEFLSPYLAIPFNNICRLCLNNADYADLVELLSCEDYLLPDEREEAFRAIRIFIDENISILRNLSEVTLKQSLPALKHWAVSRSGDFLNYLPDEFTAVKIDLVVHLVNFTVKIQHTNKKMCRAVSKELVKVLNLPPNLMNTVDNNDRAYQGKRISSGSKSGTGNYWWVVWVIFMLMRMLMKC
ncbi:MAG: hypothetical protein ABI402_14615 [Ferruginibacter sp.]